MLAATKFAEWAPDDFHITVLVDFENDSVRTALDVARALGPRLWGVRLDTSGQLVDRSLWDEMGDFDPRGVNERLVRKVRAALDEDGFERRRIVASGGFSVEKIEEFERRGVPVDAYGVGSSLIRGENDFTADIVVADGRPSAKVGRRLRPNPRLERVVSVSRDPLGRRHPGRLRARRRGSSTCPAPRRRVPAMARLVGVGPRARRRPRRVGRRPRADRSRDLGRAGFRDHVSAPLPARHPRRAREIPETEQVDPLPLARRRVSARARRRAGRGPPRAPAAEEELRRVHQPERRAVLERSTRPR